MSTITIQDRLTVDQYDRLVEVGILPTTNRFELIDGRIVESEPDHAAGLYTRVTPYHGGQDVPIAIDGQVVGQIPVAELLP